MSVVYLTTTEDKREITQPGNILSVTVTAPAGAAVVVDLSHYNRTDDDPFLTVSSSAGQTTQVTFRGYPCPGGLSVEPGSGCVSCIVEYATN